MSDRGAGAERLLSLVADHILEHGAATSLSGLARAVGSSNRMLLYHFGSREQLLAAASIEAYGRFPRVRAVLAIVESTEGPAWSRFHAGWLELADDENLPYLRLLFELLGLAVHRPKANVALLQEVSGEWPARIRAILHDEIGDRENGAESARADATEAALSTAILALWRGLQLVLLSGMRRTEVDAAHLAAIRALLPEEKDSRP